MRVPALLLISSLACPQALGQQSPIPCCLLLLLTPGIISSAASEASPAFTPDGRTVYLTRSNGNDYDILVSERHGAT
jgi:WD40-like Beta Propeller Repeat